MVTRVNYIVAVTLNMKLSYLFSVHTISPSKTGKNEHQHRFSTSFFFFESLDIVY